MPKFSTVIHAVRPKIRPCLKFESSFPNADDDCVLGCTELAESGVMQTMQYWQVGADKLSAAPRNHFARERFFCRK